MLNCESHSLKSAKNNNEILNRGLNFVDLKLKKKYKKPYKNIFYAKKKNVFSNASMYEF